MGTDTNAQIARLEVQVQALSDQMADLKRDVRSVIDRLENGKLTAHRLTSHDETLVRLGNLHDHCRAEVLGEIRDLQIWRAKLMGRYAVILGLVMFGLSIASGVLAGYISNRLP